MIDVTLYAMDWKSRLSKVSTDEVDEEVAMMAQQAVGEMEWVENVVRAMDLSTGRDRSMIIVSRSTKECWRVSGAALKG